jgi:hypothetical protein
MREICTSGSEGGAGQLNASFLPLSFPPTQAGAEFFRNNQMLAKVDRSVIFCA